MKDRVINFSAGPSTLPVEILEKARDQLLNWNGAGLSVMEMSHRSPEFMSIRDHAEAQCRKIFNIPDDYDVLFLQGGATLQFSMVPLNLCKHNNVDFIHTGSWTKKALKEIQKVATCKVIASSEDQKFLELPRIHDLSYSENADFTYLCSNNTIFGTQFKQFPSPPSGLVADMSSDILSRQINISDFDLIFAGAQKNIGPSGVTLVIMKKGLASNCPEHLPSMLQYQNHIDNQSLFNTPPTFGIYMAGLMFDWIDNQGGLAVIEEKNQIKAKVLYDAIEHNPMFYSPIRSEDRSAMNVVFRVQGNHVELEETFIKEAKEVGLTQLKGHRSVGGLRASIYNAQTLANVQALVDFMETFSRQHQS